MRVGFGGVDGYCIYFYENEVEALQKELYRREKETVRPVYHSSEVVFGEVDILAPYMYPKPDKDLLWDTQFGGTGLVVSSGVSAYLIASTAMNSIKNRIEIYGSGFDKLSTKLKTLVLNDRFEKMGKEVRFIVTDGKVRAILSAGTAQSYAVIPMAEVFEALVYHLKDRFEPPIMQQAVLTYEGLTADFVLPEKREELSSLYGLDDIWLPGIRLITSDTGEAANTIFPYWTKKGLRRGFQIAGETISQEHRGEAQISGLLKELPKVFSRYQNVAQWMVEAMGIEIPSPKGFVAALGKRLGLSKKFVLKVLSVYEAYPHPYKETVYSIVEYFLEALNEYEAQGQYLENQMGKLFTIPHEELKKIAEIAKEEEKAVELFTQLTLI